ncbi:MAG TPA: L-ribulose-5-phosphate 4-epimerase [Anaerolineales bacterium]|nr:L-ribulose-5-phosphate 4-epimerase [Anaerolineales bacterium]
MLEQLKEELVQLHLELPKNDLVRWTGGNVSARDPESGLVVIKASGIRYEDMRPQHMVVMDLEGNRVEGAYKPSSDVYSHIYVYNHRPDVGGVVHTHSRYATAFAAVGREIPCVLTAMGDEFGGPIPCGGFSMIDAGILSGDTIFVRKQSTASRGEIVCALIGDEAIGRIVVESIGKSPAVLLKNHGVFTIGKTAEAAVKAAVMTEDVAATVWLALQLGTPDVIPQADVDKLHLRYTTVYGQ